MYTIDGIPPVDPAGVYKLLAGTGVRGFAGRRVGALELPGMHGEILDTRSPVLPGTLPVSYRFYAQNHGLMMAAYERMLGVFGQSKLLEISHDYGNGQTRVNWGQVVQAAPPELPLCNYSRFNVTLRLPNPFWRSPGLVTAGTPPLTTTLSVYALEDFVSTGPITDALIRVKGAFSTARVIDAITGDQLDITAPVTASQYVVIDTATWSARLVTSDTWTGGTDFTQHVETNRGRGHMFTLEPDQVATGGRYRVRVRATNPASSPVVEVRARLSYH